MKASLDASLVQTSQPRQGHMPITMRIDLAGLAMFEVGENRGRLFLQTVVLQAG